MHVDDHDPRLVVSLAWASPFAEGAKAVARLPQLDDSRDIDSVAARLYGMAAAAVGEHKIVAKPAAHSTRVPEDTPFLSRSSYLPAVREPAAQ
jgi:hypothetical protein